MGKDINQCQEGVLELLNLKNTKPFFRDMIDEISGESQYIIGKAIRFRYFFCN